MSSATVRRACLVATICVLCAASLMSLPGVVSAQATSDEQTQQARALFEEGLTFVEAQQWQEAADRFGRVLAIRASAIVSYNYASALVQLGRMVEASRALRGVVADPGASAEVVEAAREMLSRVEPRIGQLTVRLRGDVANVEVTIDDEPLPEGSIGIPVPVDPGEHIVRATRDGLPIARRKVEVREGSPLLNVTIDVVPLPGAVAGGADYNEHRSDGGPASEQVSRSDSDEGGSGAWLWIVGGSALAVGAAVVIGLLIANPAEADPVLGNTDPQIIHGRVMP